MGAASVSSLYGLDSRDSWSSPFSVGQPLDKAAAGMKGRTLNHQSP
jgi:hypothetical protein